MAAGSSGAPSPAPKTAHKTSAVSRDGLREWPLRTGFTELLEAAGFDEVYPEENALIPHLFAAYLAHFEGLVAAESTTFLLYVKDVVSDFRLDAFEEPGRMPLRLPSDALPPQQWEEQPPTGAGDEEWERVIGALAASTSHDRASTTQFFRSTPIKALGSSKVVLPPGLPAVVTNFVVHLIAQQRALCELLYSQPEADGSASSPTARSRASLAGQLRERFDGFDLTERLRSIPHLFDGYFIYLTVDIGEVAGGMHQRAPGVHSDGLRDDERLPGPGSPNSHGMVASTGVHTAYWDAPFALPEDVELGSRPGESRERALLPIMAAACSEGGRKYQPAEGQWALHLSSGLQLHSATTATRPCRRLFLRGTFSTRVFNEYGRTTHNPTGSLATMLNPRLGRFETYRG